MKSAIAFRNLAFYLTCDATWQRNLRYVTSGIIKKSLKWRITRKRYVIEQKLTLITNRKSAIAVQNLSFNLTCDATWRRNRRYVTSGYIQKSLKSRVTRKRYAIEQKLTLITNRKSAIAFRNLPFYLTCDATWRRKRRYVTSGVINKITIIAYNSETVRDRAKVNRKSAIAIHNLSFNLTCDATWRINRRSVTSGLQNNSKNRVYIRNGAF